MSEVVHRGLCNIYALLSFDKKESITSPRFEEKILEVFQSTLGKVVYLIREEGILPEEWSEKLTKLVQKRNYLAHYFWYEQSHLMFEENGLIALYDELNDYVDFFSQINDSLENFLEPKRNEMGITKDIIEKQLERIAAGKESEPFIQQRKLKKQERLVKVWNVKTGEQLVSQVFETDDGCLWQLCDVGLGWTSFELPEPNWEINKQIEPYLPANINPRPKDSNPWNYEFRLKKGAVLWVKRGEKDNTYYIGVKSKNTE